MIYHLFEEELNKNNLIFKNRNVLTHHYIPENLHFRDEQIKKIIENLSPILRNEKPNNIFVYGKTGTGKTCTTKYILKHMNEFCIKNDINILTTYINCTLANTKYQVFLKILSSKNREDAEKYFGLPTTTLYEKIKDILDHGIHIVVVLDEIDRIKEVNDLVYSLTRINDEGTQGKLTIIGITNNIDFKSFLDQRSISSLMKAEVIFPPYNAEQLFVILKERCELGFKKGVISDDVISYISAIAAQESGDARYALKLLLAAGDYAVKMGYDKITIDVVKEARELAEEEIVKELIKSLPKQLKLVLLAIAKLTIEKNKDQKLFNNNEKTIKLTTGETYEKYKKICLKTGNEPRTSRSFRDYLNELEVQGLITTRASGIGYRGQTTLIELMYDPKKIEKICEDI